MYSEMEFRPINVELLDEVFRVEHESFPPDEAASRQTLETRMRLAPDYFFGAFRDGRLVGFINGTITEGSVLHLQDFYKHDENGKMMIIHGVVTRKEDRRKGVATEMLKKYLEILKLNKQIQVIALLSKDRLVHFYNRFGFQQVRVSEVRLGVDLWNEMHYQLVEEKSLEDPASL